MVHQATGVRQTLPFPTVQSFDTNSLIGFAVVCMQLTAVMAVIYQYQLESRTLFHVLALGFGGFAIHAFLPLVYRPAFFAALSIAAIFVALGPSDGAYLILLGLLLIGIAHLPLRLGIRIGLLVLTGGAFAVFRTGIATGPWSMAIWPILGSMFMFRMALYLHALATSNTKPTLATTLSYFFMLPNVCFPLYPVIDYTTYRNTYFDREALEIYRTGVKWIARGLLHLILYRAVYMHLVSDPRGLMTLGDLVQFMIATFLLYLRISGQFHLITGVMHLFGFRLPETHHLYYLASSFTDFWRRINIYWKDFMMKLFYYPSFFALKRFGMTTALVAATGIVFLGTWLLHSYQWFWLRGGFPLTPQDGLFWAVLGALVVMGALKEIRTTRARRLSGGPQPWNLSLALGTVGTFTAICVLWSLWSAESLIDWLVMWSVATETSVTELAILAALLAAGIAIAGKDWSGLEKRAAKAASSLYGLGSPATILLAALLLVGSRDLYAPIAPALAASVATVQRSTLNVVDANLQTRGYYENLDNSSRLSAQLWDTVGIAPDDWFAPPEALGRRVRTDFLLSDLYPNRNLTLNGAPLTLNSWGMRDRERTREKPPGVYRIAVLGPSHIMGTGGVRDEDTSTRQLEDLLNASGDGRTFEVLNFGVFGYALTQQLAILEEKVFPFSPDAVFFVDSTAANGFMIGHLLSVLQDNREIPFQGIRDAVREIGVDSLGDNGAIPVPFDIGRFVLNTVGLKTRIPWTEAEMRLFRAGERVMKITLDEIKATVGKHDTTAVFVALNPVTDPPSRRPPALEYAKEDGFLTLDLMNLWEGRDHSALRVAPWDNHPNAAGNQIVAKAMYDFIRQHATELKVDPVARQ